MAEPSKGAIAIGESFSRKHEAVALAHEIEAYTASKVAQERERCAQKAEAFADHYPVDIFPEPDKAGEIGSVDRNSAAMGRHAAAAIARLIRKGDDP